MKKSIGILVIAILQTIEWLAIALGFTFAVLGHSARKTIPGHMSLFYIFIFLFIIAYGYICFDFWRMKSKARIAMMIIYGFLTPFMLLFVPNVIHLIERVIYGIWFYWYLTRKKVKSQFN